MEGGPADGLLCLDALQSLRDQAVRFWISTPNGHRSPGKLYLNGEPLSERQSLAVVQSTPKTWWASHDKGTTSVFSRFDSDPNMAVTEVNARDSYFHPGAKTLNYVSSVGLTKKRTAPNGSGPIHPQQGIITAFAGKGWIIKGRTLADCAC